MISSTVRRWLLSLVVIAMVLISGTTVGDVIPLLRTVNAGFGLVMVVIWVASVRRSADTIDRISLVALLLFLTSAVASSFPRQSFDAALAAVAWTSAFGVARRGLRSAQMRSQLLMVLGTLGIGLSIAVAVLWGSIWLQWLSLTDWRSLPPLDLRLPSAIWGHRHDLTTLLCVLAPAVWLGRGTGVRRVIAYVALAATAAVVVMDGSRTVWAALLGAALLAGLGPFVLRALRRRDVLVAVVAVLAVVGVVAVLGGLDELVRRVTTMRTLEARGAQWISALDIWTHHPAQGTGPGSFPFVLRLTDYFDAHSYVSRHPDNGYVQLITELGLLGVGAALAVLAAVVAHWRQGGSMGRAVKWVVAFVMLLGLGTNPFEYGFLIVPILAWAAVGTSVVEQQADDVGRTRAPAPAALAFRGVALAGSLTVAAAFASLTIASFAFERAGADEAAGRYPQAEASLDLAVILDPGMALYVRERGTARLLGGDPEGAIDDYRRAAEINPADDTTFRDLALARQMAGSHQGALAAARMAVDRDAADPLNQIVMADMAAALGHAELATRSLVRVLVVYPWIAADPGWATLSGDHLASAQLLQEAEATWAAGSEVAIGPLTPTWLVSLSRADADAERAAAAARGLHRTSSALLALLDCNLDDAIKGIQAAETSEGASGTYWIVRMLIDHAVDRADARADALAFIRLPQLRSVIEGRVPSSDPYSGGFQDEYGYRRLRVTHAGIPAGPSPLGGLQAWLADPFRAAAVTNPQLPLASCGT